MIDPSLLQILCCPESHQSLRLAEPGLIQKLNAEISAGSLKNRAGKPVSPGIEEGLLREDGKFLYPVRNNIPVMLIDEAIPLELR